MLRSVNGAHNGAESPPVSYTHLLEEGEEADFLVYTDDPRDDLRMLIRPHRIVLRGRAVRLSLIHI